MGIMKRGKNYVIDYYHKGKRYRETVGPSKKMAEAAFGKRLVEIREGKFFDRIRIEESLMEDLVREYLARYQRRARKQRR